MRILSLLWPFLFVMNCIYSQTGSLTESIDTTSVDNGNSFSVNYRMVPVHAKFETRYYILSNVNENEPAVLLNYALQDLLIPAKNSNSDILTGFEFLKNNLADDFYLNPGITIGEKEIYYGSWRNNLIRSSGEVEIKQSMINGTRYLIDLGYTDLGRDFLPFITGLMEESHLINYDHARLYPGKASKGIVPSVEILNAMVEQNTSVKAGVCRDIHETGRELLKTLAETWYGHFYPEKEIDFDDYIFLQSWTTNKSQHVTVSLINPLNINEVYELDWGRVIQRNYMKGFNSGRLYGNNYRIWQYDSKNLRTTPVDFKRTQFGKILDEDILTREEYQQFNGIYDEEFFSDIRYHKSLGKSGQMQFSLGTYHPYQKYFLSSWYLNSGKKKITSFLNHSNKYALQAVIHEDTREKTFLYPQIDWNTAVSLMTVPRYISSFETPEYSSGNFSFKAYMNQQIDAFLIANSFITSDTLDKSTHNSISASGDGNLSFSNGFNINYKSRNRFLSSSAGVQARSSLLANDIRLFSPDPGTFFSNLKIITPAIDVFGNILLAFQNNSILSFDALFEFTNMEAVLFSGSVSGEIGISEKSDIGIYFGTNDQLKGVEYFWYPVQRKWVDLSLLYSVNTVSIGLMRMPMSGTTFNVSFRRELF